MPSALIGGYAVWHYAQPRGTKDMDLLVGPDQENARALHAALAEFGAPLDGISAEDFTVPGTFFRMGTPPLMVDILPAIQGVDFEGAWERRTEVEIDTESGLRVGHGRLPRIPRRAPTGSTPSSHRR